jgi:hypothetical protein
MMHKAWAEATDKGWVIGNGRIRLELAKTAAGGLALASLSRPAAAGEKSGYEWALKGSSVGPALGMASAAAAVQPEDAGFRLADAAIDDLADGAVQLTVSFADARRGAHLALMLKCFPGSAAIECTARLSNRGTAVLPLVYAVWPLCLSLAKPGASLRVSTADPKGRHGFYETEAFKDSRSFSNWIVVEDRAARESLLLGGDLGADILRFSIEAASAATLSFMAGTNLPPQKEGTPSAIELAPGQSALTPLTFLALALGGPDDVANEAFRYLKRNVLPAPIENSPLAAYTFWVADPDAEEICAEELTFARRTGFDVFYHDASWVEGSSLVPGMNDWALGLGTWRESTVKFPHGLAAFARKVREAGMKFGIWVDPGMADAARVDSGEIPRSWIALRGGKVQQCRHPSLAVMTQLCLGNPDVVAWVKRELAGIIDKYGLEWIKWDPSGTVNHACDCPDHGHGKHGGAWAAYEGLMDIWTFLLEKYPNLTGFECDPSLRHCRTNPGPRTLLPGGFGNKFVTGPMVGPYVVGSLATIRTTDSSEIRELTAGWCTASTLDYSLRQHFMSGIAFGNINGMWSQFLSRAPSGYIEAFKRNLLAFKHYRHLLFEDVWHPVLEDAVKWDALEYAREDASEAVLFVYRHAGGGEKNVVKLKALDPARTYVVTSLNDRPGRERRLAGASLMGEGLAFALPDPWLAKGDGFPGPDYDGQLAFGSDIVIIREVPREARA